MSDEVDQESFPFREEEGDSEEEGKVQTVKKKQFFTCPHNNCEVKFTTKFNRDRHYKIVHLGHKPAYDCFFCGVILDSVTALKQHRLSHEPVTGFVEKECALRKNCSNYERVFPADTLTLEQAFLLVKEEMFLHLQFQLAQRGHMKASIIYVAEFIRNFLNGGDNLHNHKVYFRAPNIHAFNEMSLQEYILNSKVYVQNRIDDFLESGKTVSGIALSIKIFIFKKISHR